MLRKMLALVGVAVACGSIAAFAIVAWKVWPLKAEVNRQAYFLSSRANEAGDAADHAIQFVREVLKEANGQLITARLNAPSRHHASTNPFLHMSAVSASQELLGSVERAQGAVVAASDAVKVVDAALEMAGADEYRDLGKLFGVSPEQLHATRSSLSSVATELRSARGLLSLGDGGVLTIDEWNAVADALNRAKEFTDQMAQVVTTVRARVNETKAAVDVWTKRLAIGLSIACVLGTLGQLFLLRFCWRKLHGLPA